MKRDPEHPGISPAKLEDILRAIPGQKIGVLGDLFLDRYLDIDAALTEPSLETGLDAYQVVRVRANPGAAGTVINNLVALGVKQVFAVSVIGDDGEGYELGRALEKLGVARNWLHVDPGRRTPTYTKPLLLNGPGNGGARELNRLDIKNRDPLPRMAEEKILNFLGELWPGLDALVVLDQVSEAECGVVTSTVRGQLAKLGASNPQRVILADSRERIGLFRSVWLKPNRGECVRAIRGPGGREEDFAPCAQELAERGGRPVFCTCGGKGIWIVDPRTGPVLETMIPPLPVHGPIDPVGAGDSTSAGLVCALAAGASLENAAAFANLVASITIRQIGTTGTASPDQVRQAAYGLWGKDCSGK